MRLRLHRDRQQADQRSRKTLALPKVLDRHWSLDQAMLAENAAIKDQARLCLPIKCLYVKSALLVDV